MFKSVLCRGLAICAGILVLVSFKAEAIIDASLQMQLGNPSGATADASNHSHYLIQRTVEAIDYNDTLGEPNWASWDLTTADLGSSGRSTSFITDTNLPAGFYEVTTSDYSGAGYDRGHMCPSADRTDSDADNQLVFFMSNIIPQAAQNNEGVWGNFEDYCRSLAQSGNELLIVCGPSGFQGSLIQPSYRVQIPAYTWKIVVVVPAGSGTAASRITATNRVIAIKIPNNNSVVSTWQSYVTSPREIEAITGFTFFTALPSDVAAALRDKVDGQTANPPVITGVSPAAGVAGSSVVITGSNFSSATAVTFEGVDAPFTVNSSTQITAQVPRNAISGYISVTIPTGTVVVSNLFTITGATVDLATSESHFGNFSQGDTGDGYIVNVTNVGTVFSAGVVTVSNLVPTGLTATAISGVGWNVNLGTLTCTRSNALYAGAAYPPIAVTVNVSSSAPATVTNAATVANSGDTDAANDTAYDITQINPAASSGNAVALVGWDMSGQTGGSGNFGPSPLAATTTNSNVTVTGFTRGSGVTMSGSGATRGWGGTGMTAASEAAAITANQFFSFQAGAKPGYKVSFSSIGQFNYRRSGTGASTGVLQYQVGSGPFVDVTTVSYSSTASTGASLSPINLTGFPDLQNVGARTNVTFRIVNYGGSNASGTWYIYDTAISSANDFEVEGTVTSTNAPDMIIALTQTNGFTQGDVGDAYSVNVTNAGSAASAGQVTVVAVPPPGFTVTSIGGNGWTANAATLTCTRSESLTAGTGYPPITVLVNVATNAGASLTNSATVSGGGELNLANNTASVVTPVTALTPIQFWRLQWFGISGNTGTAADTFVVANDGMPNLLKYALGLNPLIAETDPTVGDISTGYLRLTAPKNPSATDVIFQAESTHDLTLPWSASGIVVDQNSASLFQAHDNTPVGAAGAGFVRLKVTRE